MKRWHFIIKPEVQLKYVFLTIIFVLVTAVLMYLAMFSALKLGSGMENLTSGEWRALMGLLHQRFVWVVVILFVSIGLISILLFHRLIGPIYVFEKIIRMLRDGDLNIQFKLRHGDELKDLAEEIQELVNYLRSGVQADQQLLTEIQRELENILKENSSNQSLTARIEAIQQKIKNCNKLFRL